MIIPKIQMMVTTQEIQTFLVFTGFCTLDSEVMEGFGINISGNAYNPTWTEIQNGNCNQ